MGLVRFTPFGRGRTSNVANHLQGAYDTLKTLTNGNVDEDNLAPNAEIHESFFTWDTHKHTDGTLAADSLSFRHFDSTKEGAGMARILYTHSPKTLILFGKKNLYVIDGDSYEGEIDFATYSTTQQAFSPGTTPSVFLSVYDGTIVQFPWKLSVVSITSQSFSYRVSHLREEDVGGTIGGGSDYIHFLAIGIAPGFLARPEGEAV